MLDTPSKAPTLSRFHLGFALGLALAFLIALPPDRAAAQAQPAQDPASPPDLSQTEPPAPAEATPLTPQEERGKQIYLTGESPSDEPVIALMGQSGVEVPASTLPCGNCHARDGKGNPEGGVDPSNLTWEALTKPYGVRHESGREHPAYTERSLKRAIAMGFDPAGNELHAAMPRYRMTLEDMDALVAYIRKLGADPDPGVGSDTLHLATLLPPAGAVGGVGEAIESVLRAFVVDLNERGGLYSRRLALHTHRLAAQPEKREEEVTAFLDRTPIFAMVGAFLAGSDVDLPRLLAEREIPLVGPFTLHPQTGFPINRQVFYLLAGLPTQGRVLVDFAAERRGESSDPEPSSEVSDAFVVFSPDPNTEEAVEAMERQAKRHDWQLARRPVPADEGGGADAVDVEALARELREHGARAVFVLDPRLMSGSFLSGLGAAEVFVPGALAGPGIFDHPPEVAERLFLALPSLPSDRTPQAVERYRALAEAHGLPRTHLNTQLSTLAAAEVLQEGLERAGREVSREKLVAALEELYDFPTGLTPRLTYNPNRRIGALGAYVVTLDPEQRTLRPLGELREPEGRR